MTKKALIDTNVLVYAYDNSEPAKQKTALGLLDRLVISNKRLISTQILSEFFVVVTLKIPDPLTLQPQIMLTTRPDPKSHVRKQR
jgi:predicted nucleic acid-binding protein